MRLSLAILAGFGLTVGLVVVGSEGGNQPSKNSANRPISFSLIDLRGETHALDQNDSRRVRAFVFLSTECPISNGSLRTLNDIRARFRTADVDLFGAVVDPSVTREQAAKHFEEF